MPPSPHESLLEQQRRLTERMLDQALSVFAAQKAVSDREAAMLGAALLSTYRTPLEKI